MKREKLKINVPVAPMLMLFLGTLLVGAVSALGQRQAGQYIRAIAADPNLTVEQAQGLAAQQAYNYLVAEYPQLPANKLKELLVYWPGIRKPLIRDAIKREVSTHRPTIGNGIESLFPSVEFDWSDSRLSSALNTFAFAAVGGDPNDY